MVPRPGAIFVVQELHSERIARTKRLQLVTKKFQDFQIEDRLTTNANGRGVEFVAFVRYGILNSQAKSLIVCVLRHFAMTTNHFFADFDSDQPLRLRRIPRDFHTTWTHGFLHPQAASHRFAG
jgi:hypothetical protein